MTTEQKKLEDEVARLKRLVEFAYMEGFNDGILSPLDADHGPGWEASISKTRTEPRRVAA